METLVVHVSINPGVDVTRSDFDDDWPLTVDEGRLQCIGSCDGSKAYFMTTDMTIYALNNNVVAEGKMPDIRDAPLYTGVDLAPLIERGVSLCR